MQTSGVEDAMSTATSFQLCNGVRMPRVGLGTFKASGQEVVNAVQAALHAGLRHIDTAAIYKNQSLVRQGIDASGVPREAVFITSKLSPYQMGTAKAKQGCRDMLEQLGGPPVDLALIHWPGGAKVPADSLENARLRLETWRVLEDMYEQGLARAIGVSNFEVAHLQGLLGQAGLRVAPMVNQIEVNPSWPATELRSFCAAHGIAVVAYAPLGTGHLLSDPAVLRVAARHETSAAQVLLAWSLAQGCSVIPKSVRQERIAEFGAFATGRAKIELCAQDMVELAALAEQPCKFCWDPAMIA